MSAKDTKKAPAKSTQKQDVNLDELGEATLSNPGKDEKGKDLPKG